MITPRRIQQQPACILHHRPFRDSSQILDIVTQDHGKIALVARGSRGSKSRLAGILRPFLPLKISWVAKGDLGTLTGAEASGPPMGIHGEAVFAAFYVNELLLHFLHRHDPQAEIFGLYKEVIARLGATGEIAATLRSFELELLSFLGYAVSFHPDAAGDIELNSHCFYDYRVEQGPVAVERAEGPMVFKGSVLQSIRSQSFEDPEVLRAANRLLRQVINYHLGGKELKSRKVLAGLHRSRISAPDEAKSKSD
ncbi:MAG: DNA repair protein RecO [Woeseiaceae bacterium]